ncbi:hypothetical protein [Xylanimonas ulmi]|uniref:Uncharacterized protein n=1 Tax=Xylanimonas ulmi TaxID=228973 RepID=A0A4Q7M219_9MICO|nr:hypothetical protein [Xylanibacterium ulmi]RZS60857.1 hypothetical protein EV386_1137 [Xylanibacterium ulmi]
MWWLVWGVLVVGTLVGAFFLGRDLWRKAVRLGHALGAASQELGDASARVADAVERAQANPADTSPTVFDDITELRQRVAEQRSARAERAAARRERQLATARGWSVEAWLAQRERARSVSSEPPR